MKLRIHFLGVLALTAGCQNSTPSTQSALLVSPYQKAPEQDGFSLLWEANARRCTKQGEAEQATYKACRMFEWQTPLYNTGTAPRTLRVHVEGRCPGPTPVQLHIAVAQSPVDVWQDGDRYRVRNAVHQQDVPLQGGVVLFTTQLPPSSREMLVAIVQPFSPAQTVEGSCRIRYRIEMP